MDLGLCLVGVKATITNGPRPNEPTAEEEVGDLRDDEGEDPLPFTYHQFCDLLRTRVRLENTVRDLEKSMNSGGKDWKLEATNQIKRTKEDMEEIEELMTSYPPPVFELHECVMRHEAIVVEIDEKEELLMKHLGGPHAEKAEEELEALGESLVKLNEKMTELSAAVREWENQDDQLDAMDEN